MSQSKYDFVPGTEVVIYASSDLRVTGWNRVDLVVDADDDEVRCRTNERTMELRFTDDGECFLPADAKLMINTIGSDAEIRNFTGEVEIQSVGSELSVVGVGNLKVGTVGGDCSVRLASGNVELRNIGSDLHASDIGGNLDIGHVGSDCSVKSVAGFLHAGYIGSDFSGNQIAGDVLIDSVGSDFSLTEAGRDVRVRAGSDIQVALALSIPQQVDLTAGSDISVHLPANPSVRVDAAHFGDYIEIDLAGQEQRYRGNHYETVLGDGGANLRMSAGSSICITDRPQNWFEATIHWDDSIDTRIFEEMNEKFNRNAEEINRMAEEAARRAEEMGRRAADRAQRAVERVNRKFTGTIHPVPPIPPIEVNGVSLPVLKNLAGPQADAYTGVSEEERMMILRMLQEKKISVEEAEKLLETLDGKA